jgi:hypothetical protein
MSSITKAVRLLVVAGAGVSTFIVAAHWSRSQRSAESGLADAVIRTAPRAVAPAPEAASAVAVAASDADPGGSTDDRKRSIPKSTGALFGTLSWLPPPPPPPPPSPPPPPVKPPAPTAPPLPFVFIGMLERHAAKAEAFLAKGDALFVVSAGDTIDNNTYRVDSLTTSEVVMTYLPLNTRQTLNVSPGSK